MSTMKTVARAAAVAVVAANLAACATVVRGTKEDFRVESTPPSARVTTSHGYSCTTPCVMKLPRKSEFDIKLTLDGYKDFAMRVTNKISLEGGAGMAGNVIIGGILGVGVDAVSGAALDLQPNPLVVEMAPEDSAQDSRLSSPVVTGGGND